MPALDLSAIIAKLNSQGSLDAGDLAILGEIATTSDHSYTLSRVFWCYRSLGGPGNIPFIEPHLENEKPAVAGFALWALCWLGQGLRLKPYMQTAIDVGFARDPRREIGENALTGAGYYLRTARDRDFAQMLIRWSPPADYDALRERKLPEGLRWVDFRSCVSAAGHAIGAAMGADPADLLGNKPLIANYVKRFIAERQEG